MISEQTKHEHAAQNKPHKRNSTRLKLRPKGMQTMSAAVWEQIRRAVASLKG